MAKLSDIFNIKYGVNYDLNKMEKSSASKGMPYVSRTEKNNGISAYVKSIPNSKINPKHTLSVALGGTVLETFYQEENYYSGRDIVYLTPKIKLTREEMFFYAVCIRANKLKYSYGRQANKTLKDLIIPGYEQIPDYVNSYDKLNETEEKKDFSFTPLSEHNDWKTYKISDLFNVKRGVSKSINEIEDELGDVNIVSSTEFNNGVSKKTNERPNQNENTITVAIDGSIGATFYHHEKYIATGHVAVLEPKIC